MSSFLRKEALEFLLPVYTTLSSFGTSLDGFQENKRLNPIRIHWEGNLTKRDRKSTLQQTKMAMKHRPLEDVSPVEIGDIPASYVSLQRVSQIIIVINPHAYERDLIPLMGGSWNHQRFHLPARPQWLVKLCAFGCLGALLIYPGFRCPW